ARSAQAQAAADLVDAADLPAYRLGRSLLGGVAVGGSVLAPPHRAVELEQLADRQVAEHRYVELAERLYHLDLAAVVEPEGEGVVGVIRDVAVGNVAAFAAVLGAGRSADRAGPSVEQRAVHADRRDVLVVDEVLDDRAIGIVDRRLIEVVEPEQVHRYTSLCPRIRVRVEQLAAYDIAGVGIDDRVERVLELGVHSRIARELMPLVAAVLVIGIPVPTAADL